MIEALRADFRVYGQTALSWLRKARACRLILVSEMEGTLVRRLLAEPARDMEEAFGIALRSIPSETRGWLLTHASRVLVRPGPRAPAKSENRRVST